MKHFDTSDSELAETSRGYYNVDEVARYNLTFNEAANNPCSRRRLTGDLAALRQER